MLKFLKSFRFRLTLAVGFMSIVVGLIVIMYVNAIATKKMTEASALSLQSIAKAMVNAMSATLIEREREILLLSKSPLLKTGKFDTPEIQSVVEEIARSYPHYSWIGITDANGVVKVALNGLLKNEDVSFKPWFRYGREGSYVGDVHEATLLAKKLKSPENNEPLRFVDFASPIMENNTLLGVVATHANWTWAKHVFKSSLPPEAKEQEIDAYVIDKTGNVIYPYTSMEFVRIPKELSALKAYQTLKWNDHHDYFSSTLHVKATVSTDLGWKIVVRQPVSKALDSVIKLHRNLVILGIIASVVYMILAYMFAAQFSRPVEALAQFFKKISQGERNIQFKCQSRLNEMQTLSHAMHVMVASLLHHEQELQSMNQTLEMRVKERTIALQEANEQLFFQSYHDALTALHNRLAANETLKKYFSEFLRFHHPFCIAIMDIDFFKKVNDTYGHDVGDSTLKSVANTLTCGIREVDFAARFGGEEFIIVFPQTTIEGAHSAAEKIRLSIENASIPIVGHVTVSIGVTQVQTEDENDEAVVKRADQLLYRAKETGRNRVVFC